MTPTDIDRLFALRALKKRIDREYKELETKCGDDLMEDYRVNGTERKIAPMFGKDAGSMYVSYPRPKTAKRIEVVDGKALNRWMDENATTCIGYALANVEDFAQTYIETTGEIMDGIEVTEYAVEGPPCPKFSSKFDADLIFDTLASGGAGLFEEVNRLLLGDGE